MQRVLALVTCMMAGLATVRGAGKWSYVGKTGPLYWHEIFPEACSGKKQSPIDLRPEETMFHPGLKQFAIWYDPPRPDSKMYIKNTGYTVQVDLKGEFFVTNAGLGHVFKAAQFHFHWGHKSHHGSEHLVQGKASPLEMHVVTYNHDLYSDIGEALTKPGGLAVLGVLFEISEEDNPDFDYVIRGMRQIRNPDKVAKVELPLFSLRNLLPENIDSYFRYNGSLTTPGCFESVIWTVFNHKQALSRKQMHEFRKLLQFKRKHHKHHNKDGDKESSRHKRELTADQTDKENNAKTVLDEVGYNGKDSGFERELLKKELTDPQVQPTEIAGSEVLTVYEGGDNHKAEKEPQYVQDPIVNNFRPAQPLNGRVVYRSFKLREVVIVTKQGGPRPVEYQPARTRGNGAKATTSSMFTAAVTMFTAVLVSLR